MEPFLSIVTRHMVSRPKMLKRCEASLRAQTCQDFEHLVFRDDKGRGMQWAQAWLMELIPQASGEYILVLDDDDYMPNEDGVKILKDACGTRPMGVICQGHYGPSGILPKEPEKFSEVMFPLGKIGVFSYVLRADVYKRSLKAYEFGDYEGDWIFLSDVWQRARDEKSLDKFVFLRKVICAVQRFSSQGRPEGV